MQCHKSPVSHCWRFNSLTYLHRELAFILRCGLILGNTILLNLRETGWWRLYENGTYTGHPDLTVLSYICNKRVKYLYHVAILSDVSTTDFQICYHISIYLKDNFQQFPFLLLSNFRPLIHFAISIYKSLYFQRRLVCFPIGNIYILVFCTL